MTDSWDLHHETGEPPFRSLPQTRVLVEFEEPWVFVSEPEDGVRLLVYFSEAIDGSAPVRRHVVAPTTTAIIESLELGDISVYDALTRSWMWIVDVGHDGDLQKVYVTDVQQLPQDALPPRSMMLHAGLEPAIILRFEGDELVGGNIPANVLQVAGAAVQGALKPLSKFVFDNELPAGGRRTEFERSLYNLRAQRIGTGSLEVAFRARSAQGPLFADEPAETLDEEKRMWRMLRVGLDWAQVADSRQTVDELPAESDEERLAILKALEALAPTTSSVNTVTIGGRYIANVDPNTYITLDRASAKNIRAATATIREKLSTVTERKVFVGWVRDLDLDTRTLKLRLRKDDEATESTVAVLDDEDDFLAAKEAHYHEARVELIASREKSLSGGKDGEWVVEKLRFEPSSQ